MVFGFVEQGPVLSAHKNLIAQKLAEEEAEKKAKGQARKANHLVPHEKIIIGVATKGRMVASMLNSSVNSIFHIVGENIEIRH